MTSTRNTLQIGGNPATVAEDLRKHPEAGFDQVICVFRDPCDFETMARLGDVRASLAAITAGPGATP